MDGDRPMVDGRDLLESWVHNTIQQTIDEDERIIEKQRNFLESLIPHFDSSSSDVGAQDEASEAREVGDGVRPKSRLIPRDPNAFVVDEWDPVKKITDDFAREMELRFAYEGKRVAMGHCDLTKKPDGTIRARINFFPQNPR